MKKSLLASMLLMTVLTATAADKAARLKEIRQAYAEAKKGIDDNNKKGAQRMDVTLTVEDGSKVSEDFVVNEERTIKFYFKRVHQTGANDLFEPCCYFVTDQWSADGHTTYREMLFNVLTGYLMFSFMKAETHAGFVVETRYYYDEVGDLIDEKYKVGDSETTSAAQSWTTPGGDQTRAMTLSQTFLDLMRLKGDDAERYTAQTVGDKAALLKEIRALYADAKQKIQKDAKSETPMNVRLEVNDQEDPEMPAQKDVVRLWFEHDAEGAAKPYFMTTNCQLGDHSVYSEYLLGSKTPDLLFCFSQQQQNEGPALEWRYYFDRSGRCIEVKGNSPRNGPGFADRHAAKGYLELFEAAVNLGN